MAQLGVKQGRVLVPGEVGCGHVMAQLEVGRGRVLVQGGVGCECGCVQAQHEIKY
jgi:hypothetical protein